MIYVHTCAMPVVFSRAAGLTVTVHLEHAAICSPQWHQVFNTRDAKQQLCMHIACTFVYLVWVGLACMHTVTCNSAGIFKPAHPNDLDTTGVSLVIRFCAFKRWQEAMVDVDSVTGMPGAEIRAEYLHVSAATVKTCQHFTQMLRAVVTFLRLTMLLSVSRTVDSTGNARIGAR